MLIRQGGEIVGMQEKPVNNRKENEEIMPNQGILNHPDPLGGTST